MNSITKYKITHTMKLFTEEQMKDAIRFAREKYLTEKAILMQFEPIELPSDEEIEEKFDTGSNRLDSQMYESGFRDGAKWIKDKIQGGNK